MPDGTLTSVVSSISAFDAWMEKQPPRKDAIAAIAETEGAHAVISGDKPHLVGSLARDEQVGDVPDLRQHVADLAKRTVRRRVEQVIAGRHGQDHGTAVSRR